MIIERRITTTINLSPSEVFNPNQENVIMARLKETLQGRCKYSMLFLEILRIEKCTAKMLPRDRSDGTCDADVTFWARCICVSDGEIIQECDEIHIKDAHTMYATHALFEIKLIGDITPFREILGKNVKLPIMAHGRPVYTIGRPKISIIGKFYLPRPKEPFTKIFMFDRGLSAEETEKVGEVTRLLKEEIARHKPLKEMKQYKFFEDILKNADEKDWSEEKWPLLERLSLAPMKVDDDFSDMKKGIITFPAGDSRGKLRFFYAAGDKESLLMQASDSDMSTCSWISVDLYAAILLRINQCIVYLQNLRGFVTTFDTQEKIAKLFDYWTLCMSINSK